MAGAGPCQGSCGAGTGRPGTGLAGQPAPHGKREALGRPPAGFPNSPSRGTSALGPSWPRTILFSQSLTETDVSRMTVSCKRDSWLPCGLLCSDAARSPPPSRAVGCSLQTPAVLGHRAWAASSVGGHAAARPNPHGYQPSPRPPQARSAGGVLLWDSVSLVLPEPTTTINGKPHHCGVFV